MIEELKFPLKFDSCPNCGSTKRIAGSVAEQEKEKGRIGKDAQGFIQKLSAIITDPRIAALQAPIVIAFMDICSDCGTYYCVLAQLGTATPGPPSRKGPSLKGFEGLSFGRG